MTSKNSPSNLWLLAIVVGIVLPVVAKPAIFTFAQPLEGSCYVAKNGQCYIDVDSFTVQVNESSGERAAEFILLASDTGSGVSTELWSFHTSNSYGFKPIGDYTPLMPPNDFPATCSKTYYLSILTRGDTPTMTGSFGNAGRTGAFSCPAPFFDPNDIIFMDGFE